MLAFIPKPVHALIFLFRYRETDKDDIEDDCPDHIWFAEQVPDFSCASVALLNIVNNIPGLDMGKDLNSFKDLTQDMTPRNRGEAIDDFTFVKRIHNSFASEADLLEADMHYKEKQARERKRQAVAKAQKTKAANAARKKNAKPTPATPQGARSSARSKKTTVKSEENVAPAPTPPRTTHSPPKETSNEAEANNVNGQVNTSKKSTNTSGTPDSTNKSTTPSKKSKGSPIADAANAAEPSSSSSSSSKKRKLAPFADSEIANKAGSPAKKRKTSSSTSTPTRPNGTSHESDAELSEPTTPPKTKTTKKLKLKAPKNKTNLDDDGYASSNEEATSTTEPRRSARAPKPRKTEAETTTEANDASEAEEEEGFHFCAYIPIGDRVWKLDGMDRFPQDMGPVEEGKDWLSVAQPALQGRMAQYEAGAIEFNLMAVVHDPMLACVEALAANVKTLQAVEGKLDGVGENWRDATEANGEVVVGESAWLGLQGGDIERAEIHCRDLKALGEAEDLAQLFALREEIVLQQTCLRAACRDEMDVARSDDHKARIRRHDFSGFAREWVGALAEGEVLEALIDGEE